MIAATTLPGLFSLASPNEARAGVPQTAACSGIEIMQTAAPVEKGQAASLKPPTRFIFTTATLLKNLALDETTAGKWPWKAAAVPPNTKLMAAFSGGPVSDAAAFKSLSFQVVNGTTVVDVSNILTAKAVDGIPTNAVRSFASSGELAGNFSPPFSLTYYLPYLLSYNAAPAGGSLQFGVTGTATLSATVSPLKSRPGHQAEKDNFSLADGTGSGAADGVAFILTGVTITASGTAIVDLN